MALKLGNEYILPWLSYFIKIDGMESGCKKSGITKNQRKSYIIYFGSDVKKVFSFLVKVSFPFDIKDKKE